MQTLHASVKLTSKRGSQASEKTQVPTRKVLVLKTPDARKKGNHQPGRSSPLVHSTCSTQQLPELVAVAECQALQQGLSPQWQQTFISNKSCGFGPHITDISQISICTGMLKERERKKWQGRWRNGQMHRFAIFMRAAIGSKYQAKFKVVLNQCGPSGN